MLVRAAHAVHAFAGVQAAERVERILKMLGLGRLADCAETQRGRLQKLRFDCRTL